MKDGYLTASGHNWVEGQGSGPRIDQKKDDEEEEVFDAMGNRFVFFLYICFPREAEY